MKSKRLLTSVLVVSLGLVGCGQRATDMDPEKVIQKMTENFLGRHSKTIDLDLNATVVSTGGDATLGAKAKIKSDGRNLKKLKSEATIELEGNGKTAAGENAGKINFSFAYLADTIYFKLDSLNIEGEGSEMIDQLMTELRGKWYKISKEMLPAELQESLAFDSKKIKEMNNLNKKIAKIDFFDLKENKGTEAISGEETVHYLVTLNKDGVKNYLKEATAANGQEINENDLLMVDEWLNNAVYDLDLWIDTDDFYLRKVQLATVSTEEAGTEARVTVLMDNFDEDLGIKEPEGATDFNPMMLMGLAGMMGGMTTMPTLESDLGTDSGIIVTENLKGTETNNVEGLEVKDAEGLQVKDVNIDLEE